MLLAISAVDLPKYVHNMSPFPFQSRDPFRAGNPTIKFHDRNGLAEGKVRFVGEPVALIVAQNRYIAEDALELVEAQYELLDPLFWTRLKPTSKDSPLLYEDWGDNVALRFRVANGDVEKAFAEATWWSRSASTTIASPTLRSSPSRPGRLLRKGQQHPQALGLHPDPARRQRPARRQLQGAQEPQGSRHCPQHRRRLRPEVGLLS